MSTQPMKILNFLVLPCKKLANQKWISSKCEYLSKINQGSRPTRVSTGFLLFTLFLQVTHSLQVKKCQISQRNCQIKFKFGSKEAIITILKSSSLKTPCSELRQTQSWCIQDPGKIDKKIFKQSEEIDPLINTQYFYRRLRGKRQLARHTLPYSPLRFNQCCGTGTVGTGTS